MGAFIQKEIAKEHHNHHFDGLHLTVMDGHITRLGKRGSDVCTGWGWMDAGEVPGNRSQRVLVRSFGGWFIWPKLYTHLQFKISKICTW